MKAIKKLAGISIVALYTQAAAAIAVLPEASIIDYKAAGTGCADGSGATAELVDGVLKLKVPTLKVSKGSGVSLTESRKFCQFIIDMDVPEGWTYGLTAVLSSARTNLAAGASAKVSLLSYFSGPTTSSDAEAVFSTEGLRTSSFFREMAEPVYAPCDANRSLKIKQSINVTGGAADASSSASLRTSHYVLDWKKCN